MPCEGCKKKSGVIPNSPCFPLAPLDANRTELNLLNLLKYSCLFSVTLNNIAATPPQLSDFRQRHALLLIDLQGQLGGFSGLSWALSCNSDQPWWWGKSAGWPPLALGWTLITFRVGWQLVLYNLDFLHIFLLPPAPHLLLAY